MRAVHILILVLILNLPGCGPLPPHKAYQAGKKLSDLAVVECDSEKGQRVYITKINGKFTCDALRNFLIRPWGVNVAIYPERAIIEPGRHYLGVCFEYERWRENANGNLWFDAEAGKTYIIRKDVNARERRALVTLWVEEKESGKVIGGIPDEKPGPLELIIIHY